ncbi:unnamed protein product [Phytophthora fragariaefolia]|uniref:Unnamed protein product n=1 Tax=Phytophthora fragariaefolia TaxID=1490495 RepID=A0A9W7CZ07_9STRA|nr:unnamed protein product [Phytophthora fragariaefolia]
MSFAVLTDLCRVERCKRSQDGGRLYGMWPFKLGMNGTSNGADSIDPELTSQSPPKPLSPEEHTIMHHGVFVVLAVACFFANSDLAVASISKDTMARKTYDMASTKDRNGGRLLRASAVGGNRRYENVEGEDRASAFLDWVKSLLQAKKTAPDLKRTFPSPPVADKLVRSKSFKLKKTTPMAKKLRRSESATFGLTLKQILDRGARSRANDFQHIYKMKKNPGDIVVFFNLDASLLVKKGTTLKQLEKASGNGQKFGEYKIWHSYSKFFKKRNPEWVSKFSSS